jgi:hypothetical protein
MKSYSNRMNAKRAAIASGIPADEVEIVPLKEAGKPPRFGFKRAEMLDERNGAHFDNPDVDEDGLPKTRSQPKRTGTAAEKRSVATPAQAAPRVERNGVKRPRAGGVCAAVWSWLDDHKEAKLVDVRDWATKKGLNPNNAGIELYAWRKFNAPKASA